MIYEITDMKKVEELFAGWEETLIYSCLQKVMGKIYVTDTEGPESAMAYVGCFGFLAGIPDKELIMRKPDGFSILVPQNEDWSAMIEECFPDSKRVTRYAIRKDTVFDEEYLNSLITGFKNDPKFTGYGLKAIDAELYELCLNDPVTRDFVLSFESKERYLELGRGMVIMKEGRIVAGASSFTRYKDGIEIEVDTAPDERRKGLATVCSAALILNCLEEGLYPSWDAANLDSVHLSEKLGYEFDHEYAAYEVNQPGGRFSDWSEK